MINVKFYMYFNGERIRTLEELRENFIAEDVLEAYSSGQLAKWLKVWRHQEELEHVEAIESENAREILRELVRIFDPEAEAEEIDAELTVYDYLEERRKFREYMMTHGLGELETLRRERETSKREHDKLSNERDSLRRELDFSRTERDSLKQENYRLKRELEDAKRKTTSNTIGGRGKRVYISAKKISDYNWYEVVPSYSACRIIDVGNCEGKLMVCGVNGVYGAGFTISESCSRKIVLNGISVRLAYEGNKDLYFDYEEV